MAQSKAAIETELKLTEEIARLRVENERLRDELAKRDGTYVKKTEENEEGDTLLDNTSSLVKEKKTN